MRFDEHRVYLTGFGFAGAYAWMLAYDRPDLYAAVVAVFAPSYPPQVQQRLDSGESVVTVIVRGANHRRRKKHIDQDTKTGQSVEARNSHAKFILKRDDTENDLVKDWIDNLNYVLQFRKAESGPIQP